MSVCWITMQCSPGALCNICKVTKQYRFVSLHNGRNDLAIATNRFYKIFEMKIIKVAISAYGVGAIACYAFLYFFDKFVVIIKDFVIVITKIYECSFIPV